MAYGNGQKEIPGSRNYKRKAKKARTRKIRRQPIDKPIQYNRYKGYA